MYVCQVNLLDLHGPFVFRRLKMLYPLDKSLSKG